MRACSSRLAQSSMPRRCRRRWRVLFRHIAWHQPCTCTAAATALKAHRGKEWARRMTGRERDDRRGGDTQGDVRWEMSGKEREMTCKEMTGKMGEKKDLGRGQGATSLGQAQLLLRPSERREEGRTDREMTSREMTGKKMTG